MCILIVKPAGADVPPYDIIEKCIAHNPDGFGFSTPNRVYKTLDWLDFVEQLYKVRRDEPCIIHCRWATHGSIKRANCHPFYDKQTGVAFAHNGILSVKPMQDMTDSETAFRKYFVPTIKRHGLYSKALTAVVNLLIGYSKFAFIDREGHLKTYGQFTEINGCFYSNTRFLGSRVINFV